MIRIFSERGKLQTEKNRDQSIMILSIMILLQLIFLTLATFYMPWLWNIQTVIVIMILLLIKSSGKLLSKFFKVKLSSKSWCCDFESYWSERQFKFLFEVAKIFWILKHYPLPSFCDTLKIFIKTNIM